MGLAAARRLRLDHVRALVVEDDLDLRELVVESLEMEGAFVSSAETGAEALRVFASQHPDVLVSDLWMPEATGFQLIESVRKLPVEQGGLVPAIAVSAAENMRSAVMAGFHVFLAKPFDIDRLVDTIADFASSERGQAVAPWTLVPAAPDQVLVTFVGRVEPGDVRAMAQALLLLLERSALELLVDLRRLTSFAPSAASIAERALWDRRHRIRRARIIGGSALARLVAAGACRTLAIPCAFADTIEGPEREEP